MLEIPETTQLCAKNELGLGEECYQQIIFTNHIYS